MDMENFAKTKNPMVTQPFLLAHGHDNSTPSEYFVIVDATTIPCGSSATEAFDRLFKVFCVFWVEYPEQLETFYNFFAGIVYECTSEIKSSVRARYAQMLAVATNDE